MKTKRKILLVVGVVLVAVALVGYLVYSSTRTIEVPEIVLTAEWELTGPADDPNYIFNRASAIRYQAGYLYVCDQGNNRIMKYDENGRFIAQIGRAGQGPGEFLNPIGFAVHPDGSLFVLERGNGRVQIFDSLGRHVRSFNVVQHLAGIRANYGIFDIDQEKRVFIPSGTLFSSLVSVYSEDGTKIREVGSKLDFSSRYRPWQRNNEFLLTVEFSGSVIVQFFSVPIIRKYGRDGDLLWEKDFSRVTGVRRAVEEINVIVQRNSTSQQVLSLTGFASFLRNISDRFLIMYAPKMYLIDKELDFPFAELLFYRDNNVEIFPRDVAVGPSGKLYVLEEDQILRYSIQDIIQGQ